MRNTEVAMHPDSKLTLIRRIGKRGEKWFGLYRCVCGSEKELRMTATGPGGGTLSCGCLGKVVALTANKKHGRCYTSEYHVWQSMIQRCINPNRDNYPRYGGRGITVCARWLESFDNFYADMGPSNGLSIERNDNDGNYEPANCRWATMKEQAANKTYPKRGKKS